MTNKQLEKSRKHRDALYEKFLKLEEELNKIQQQGIEAERECLRVARFSKHETKFELPSINFSGWED